MAWVAVGVAVAGLLMQASAARKAGKAMEAQGAALNEAKHFDAAQLEVNAGQAEAAAQREGFEQERQARVLASRALAVGGASGAGVSDPTAMDVIADIEGVGALRKATAIYQGGERARQMRMAAAGARFEGMHGLSGSEASASATRLSATGAALAGGASLYARYGQGGPSQTPVTSNAGATHEVNQDAGITDLRYG